jgi:hypothetical protein
MWRKTIISHHNTLKFLYDLEIITQKGTEIPIRKSSNPKSKPLYDWRFTANQIVLAPTPWDSRPETFFQLNTCSYSPYVTSSLTRGWVCLLWVCLALSSVHFAHTACYWKFFLLHYIQVLCQYRLCKADHAYLTYLMLQRQLSHSNGRKLDHRQFQPSFPLRPCIPRMRLHLLLEAGERNVLRITSKRTTQAQTDGLRQRRSTRPAR